MKTLEAIMRITFLLMSFYWFTKGEYAHAAFDLLLVVLFLLYELRDKVRAVQP